MELMVIGGFVSSIAVGRGGGGGGGANGEEN